MSTTFALASAFRHASRSSACYAVVSSSQRLLSSAAATEYDLAIIGAGPGGYVGAIKAAQLGLKVGINYLW